MAQTQRLEGRVALVTGGSRGIGRAIALALGAAGAKVVVNYRRDVDAAQEVVARIGEHGGDALAVAASVDEPVAVEALAGAALDRFGAVDLLVHNAGIASRGLPVAETTPEEVQRVPKRRSRRLG